MEAMEFPTKTGCCIITDETVTLHRTGWRGALANRLLPKGIQSARLLYGWVGGTCLVLALALVVLQGSQVDVPGLLFCLLMAVVFLRQSMRTTDLSGTPVIHRAAITSVDAIRPLPAVTRGHFIVHFQDQGEARRRLIILPGVAQGGAKAWTQACAVMRDAGLLQAEVSDAASDGASID